MAKFKLIMLTSKISYDSNYVNYIETPISEFYSQSDIYETQTESGFSYEQYLELEKTNTRSNGYYINGSFYSDEDGIYTMQADFNTIYVDIKTQQKYIYNGKYIPVNIWLNNQHVYCYSFGEKINIHTNGQKELQFSMLRNIWIDNELTVNPFVTALKNGSQVLLIDQYDNEYFFTIKNISYSLGSSNITYNYSCQDSFTYQHIRQNNGYVISNDAQSETFIGAKNVDWWVVNKIQPECKISYQYVPLSVGLYMDKNNNIQMFQNAITNINKVIKPIYDRENYNEYYERIPFSVSGSNASASLISLADELGLMVNFRECNVKNSIGKRTEKFVRYFWFEPKRNEQTANLKYSPNTTIQNFNFSQSGNSLSTILNVEGKNTDDEMVTLIPEIPYFFANLFSSPSWEKTSFNTNFFTSICQEQVYIAEDGSGDFQYLLGETDIEYKDDFIYIPVFHKVEEKEGKNIYWFSIPYFYDKISFKTKAKASNFIIDQKYNTIHSIKWEFVIREEIEKGVFKDTAYNDTYSLIPERLWGTDQICFVRIYFPNNGSVGFGTSQFVLRFYRDVTSEELEFAEIADKCPWLENKIIDFSYFYKNKILSQLEYQSLLNILQNELRIINGKLLYFSKDYFTAIHSKTALLSELVNTLDSVGAAFASDVVEQYKRDGSVKDIRFFNTAYDTMISKYYKIAEQTTIVNYRELLTDYWNKYFNARQRFLKNIYNFKQFFNQPKAWGEQNAKIYKVLLELKEKPSPTSNILRYWSFNKDVSFSMVNSSFSLFDENYKPTVKIYESDKKTEATVVHKGNITNFYTNLIDAGSIIPCTDKEGFSPTHTYFRVAYVMDNKKGTPDVLTGADNKLWYRYKKDDTNAWYCSAEPERTFFKTQDNQVVDLRPDIIEVTDKKSEKQTKFTLTKTFIEITRKDILNEYIYTKFKSEPKLPWFYHDTNTQTSVNAWWDDNKINDMLSIFHPTVFGNTFTQNEWNDTAFSQLIARIKTYLTGVDDNEASDDRVNFYKSHFPIKQVTFKGVRYKNIPYSVKHGETTVDFTYQPVNQKGQTLTDYLEYLKDKTLPVVKNPFAEDQKDSYTIPIVNADNESKYFRRVPKLGLAIATSIILSPAILAAPIYPLGAIGSLWVVKQALFNSDTKWETSGLNTANFLGKRYVDVNYTGYHDSSDIIYARTNQSYNEYLELHEERKIDNFYGVGNVTAKGEIVWNSSEPFDYYDFYSKVAFTYSSAINNNCLFTDGYLRPLDGKSKINPKYKYRVLCLNDTSGKDLIFTSGHSIEDCGDASSNYQISKVLYYFLFNNTSEFDVQGVVEGTELKNVLSGGSWNGYVYTKTENVNDSNVTLKMIFFQEEDFKRVRVVLNSYWNNDGILKFNHRFSLYSSTKDIHDYENSSIINLINEDNEDITYGFYKQTTEDSYHIPIAGDKDIVWIEDENGHLPTKFFIKTNDEKYERVYSILQMKDMKNKFYYIFNNTYQEEIIGQKNKFQIPIYLHTDKYEEVFLDEEQTNSTWHLIESTVESENVELEFDDYYNSPVTKTFTINSITGDFTNTCTIKVVSKTDLNNLTNGEFWYQFHTRDDNAVLFEEASVIETQLTQYWQQAYSSSLYCEYFLPEHWQSRVNGESNYFNNNIIKVENGKILLSNKYIPEVSIYVEETSLIPKWELTYVGDLDSSYTIDTVKAIANDISYSSAQMLSSNLAFTQAFAVLNEKLSNFEVLNDYNNINQPKTNYYYVSNENTGTKWKNMLQSHSTIATQYEKYSGLYVMAYDILKTNFKERTTHRYSSLKEQQRIVWENLYKKFPGVLLETSFKNDYASTSLELYNLASIAFKDQMNVENNYSISLINAYKSLSIKNNTTNFSSYKGQELKIGDGILIDVDDYYNQKDDVYQAMSQYLFITDISYDLRKDSDIQLTVNSIKYQDKLIQRLVKLIK